LYRKVKPLGHPMETSPREAIKTCPYCGRENSSANARCQECGTLLSPQAPKGGLAISGLGGCLLIVGVIVTVLFFAVGSLFRLSYATPKLGYAGEWRPWNFEPVEERPLPPAETLWSNYQAWCAEAGDGVRRLYVARMGHAHRQKNFRVHQARTHNVPWGDYIYTSVEFDYHDPTNGVYHLEWDLPGKHSPNFLRFDDTKRLILLQLSGTENSPRLSIEGVEGTRPFKGSPRDPNNMTNRNRVKQRTNATLKAN